ncbi:HAD hydrolase-like protein [Cupriavidus sp. KK10]|jgi:putative hydrolase of the HAD superfamily|uniref:HAD family hydrolase n=1 Tax=Cupriavidus sp. KK10 TaxID=1478019 RepID=UPI001BA93204|nr:HAD family hydrolase [Cupriavidus sp. KK10]QUN27731.1 HAD hydrolase-like protein [Cupriavidus sp. KK10]
MTLKLSDFDAITFDVYGTLIDWEPSIADFLLRWAAENNVTADAETLVMTFDGARACVQKERPAHLYPEVLTKCFDIICAEFKVPVNVDRRRQFAASPHTWPAFADSRDGLKQLQQSARIGALSNIDVASLNTSCRILNFEFDVVVTAQRVGAYKPDWPHFDTGIGDLMRLGVARDRILHVGQSLRADITPANKLGLRSAWINRPGRLLGLSGEGAAEACPDLTVSSLAELVAVLTGTKEVDAR